MYGIMETSGHTKQGITQFVIDTPDDLDDVPINVAPGSTVFCISTSAVYMLNHKHEWCEI